MTMQPWNRRIVGALFGALVGTSGAAAAAPVQLWDEAYGGDIREPMGALVPAANGDFLLVGTSDSFPSRNKTAPLLGGTDYWAVRIAPDGTIVWDKSYGGFSWDRLVSAVATPDGGFLLGGDSSSGVNGNKGLASFGSSDWWLVKIDAAGNKQWEAVYGGTNAETMTELVVSGAYVYAVGASMSLPGGNKTAPNHGNYDYWVAKLYPSSGVKVWDASFGGTGLEILYDAEPTASGGLLLTGTSWSFNNGNKSALNQGASDIWLVSMSSSGGKIWDKAYGGFDEENGRHSLVTSTGYLVLGDSDSGATGNKTSGVHGESDMWLLKLDAMGNKLGEKNYGGDGADWGAQLMPAPQSSGQRYWLGGYSRSLPSFDKQAPHKGMYDLWILEVDLTTMLPAWDITLGGEHDDILHTLHRTSAGVMFGATSQSGDNGDKTDPNPGSWEECWVGKLQ